MKARFAIILLTVLCFLFSCSQETEIPKEENGTEITVPSEDESADLPAEDDGGEHDSPQVPGDDDVIKPSPEDVPGSVTADLSVSRMLMPDTVYEISVPDGSSGWIMVMNVTPDGDEDRSTDTMRFDIAAEEIKALWNFSDPYTDAEGYVRWDRMPGHDGRITSAAECARDSGNNLIYMYDLAADGTAVDAFMNILDSLYSYRGGRLMPPDSVTNACIGTGIAKTPDILYETDGEKWMFVLISDFGENSENTLGMFSNAAYIVKTPPVIFLNIRAFEDSSETTLNNVACTIIHEYVHFCESWVRYRTNGTADQRTHILSEGLADYIAGTARGMSFSGEAGYIWFWLNDGFLWQPDTDRKADDGTSLDIMNYGLGTMIYSKLASMKGGEIPPEMITDTGTGLLPLENVTGTEAGTFIREMFLDIPANLGAEGYEDRNASYLDSFRLRDIFRLYENSSAPIASGISEAEFSRTGVHFYKLPDGIRSFSYTGPGDCMAFSLPRKGE